MKSCMLIRGIVQAFPAFIARIFPVRQSLHTVDGRQFSISAASCTFNSSG